jgi:predicted nucleic acid-binding Zn ribbon protein
MAIYEWVCRDCSIYWDREYALGKAPSRTKCPECGKLCSRYWQQQNVGISFKDDGKGNQKSNANDFHTVRRRYQKFAEEGFDEQSTNRFLKNQIEKSRQAQDDESYRYKAAKVDWDKLADKRGLRKKSTKEVEATLKSAEKLTKDAYDTANKMGYKDIGSTKLDPAKPNKNGI